MTHPYTLEEYAALVCDKGVIETVPLRCAPVYRVRGCTLVCKQLRARVHGCTFVFPHV